MSDLPAPDCIRGYPRKQLESIFDPTVMESFSNWVRGEGTTLCQGLEYDNASNKYVSMDNHENGCGIVYNEREVEHFVRSIEHVKEYWFNTITSRVE